MESEQAAPASRKKPSIPALIEARMGRWIALGGLIGVISAFGAILFHFLVEKGVDFFLVLCMGWTRPQTGGHGIILTPPDDWTYWLFPLMPALGGLLSGFIVFKYAPEAEGHGTDAYIRAYHRLRGRIRARVPVIKTIASAITIGSGGSAGQEGPIAQIGAGFGSWLGQTLKLDASELRLLLIAGTAGGIGAIFCAPLGGAVLAMEILYRNEDIETEGLIPALISSLVSFSIYSYAVGKYQIYVTPHFTFRIWELLPYAILGLICAVFGILYVVMFYGSRDWFFKKIPVPMHYKPMIGGFMLGCIGLACPEVVSLGSGLIEKAFNENLGIAFMLTLAVAKIAATSFTISSGGSGGVFGPSLFIGAMLGGALGHLMDGFMPGWVQDPRSFALVGMVAFFAGIAKVPIASLLMITEMTGSYALLAPMMLVSSLTYLITHRWTLYEEQVWTKADSPAHFGEYRQDVLAGLRVSELNVQDGGLLIPYNYTLRQIVPMILETNQNVFPVTGPGGEIVGAFSMKHIRELLLDEHMRDLVVASDIADADFGYVAPDDDLHKVLRKMNDRDEDEIPLLEGEERRFKGLVRRAGILNLYSKRLYELEQTAGGRA